MWPAALARYVTGNSNCLADQFELQPQEPHPPPQHPPPLLSLAKSEAADSLPAPLANAKLETSTRVLVDSQDGHI